MKKRMTGIVLLIIGLVTTGVCCLAASPLTAQYADFNSNSFAHGLLRAVGITPPTPKKSVPGWGKRLGNEYFGV